MPIRLGDGLGVEDYQVVRSNWQWSDHILRTYATAGMLSWLMPETVCDPACGDGSVVIKANELREIGKAYLSDISAPSIALLKLQPLRFDSEISIGPAMENLHDVDAVVLTEILEHLEDPSELLGAVRRHSRFLVASSPLDERVIGGNPEHVWGWTKAEYREMLVFNGWMPIAYQELSVRPHAYTFQLWACQ